MTNKVKPFYIRITDDMTPQMVQDAFDKCHNLGVIASNNDDIENLSDWSYFGVCSRDCTHLSDSEHGYFDAQEITLDHLDEWLGLESKVEWDGNGLPPVGVECEILTYDSPVKVDSISWHKAKILSIHDAWFGAESIVTYTCDWDPNFYVDAHPSSNLKFRKPETPEQRAERERLEAAYDLYCECVMHGSGGPIGFETFKSSHIVNLTWLRIVDKTGYRKQ